MTALCCIWLQDRQKKNERIEIDQINIEGYTIHGGQKESFSVSTDGLTVNIYYDPVTPASHRRQSKSIGVSIL